MFMPDLNKICEITLAAKDVEDVPLGGGKRKLRRIEQTTKLDGTAKPEFDITLWIDDGGQVLKSWTKNFGGMTTYRTTEQAAVNVKDLPKLDLVQATSIKTRYKFNKPEATRDVVYRVTLTDGDPAKVIPTDRRQTLRPGKTPRAALLEVRTAGPNEGAPGPDRVSDEFLQPNTLITSQDPLVVSLARRAAAGAVDPWDKAVRISHWVFENLTKKDFKTAFAPASEVAQTLAGDCTEHGVLVAAMCRAVGIPARVAIGLIYAEPQGGFGGHLWTEVYVNRRWVAIDASWDQSSVDAVHIKLSDTSLDGVAPYQGFLPIVSVLGRLSIDPVEIR
jgi:hypothetical protein